MYICYNYFVLLFRSVLIRLAISIVASIIASNCYYVYYWWDESGTSSRLFSLCCLLPAAYSIVVIRYVFVLHLYYSPYHIHSLLILLWLLLLLLLFDNMYIIFGIRCFGIFSYSISTSIQAINLFSSFFYSFYVFLYFKLLIWLVHFVRWTELIANKRQYIVFHTVVVLSTYAAWSRIFVTVVVIKVVVTVVVANAVLLLVSTVDRLSDTCTLITLVLLLPEPMLLLLALTCIALLWFDCDI